MTTTGTRRLRDTPAASYPDDYPGSSTGYRYRRRRWPWLLALVLVIALAGGGAYVVWRTPLLAVQQVAVTGARGTLAQQVHRATADQIGVPLISVVPDGVRAKVAAIPRVASVTVQRHWPNTLDVAVTARVPVAVTKANGAWWLLDADGLPYLPVQQRPPKLISVQLATPGKGDPATVAALRVLQALPKNIRDQLTAVAAASAYRVTLKLTGRRTVVWGDPTRSARKAQILPAVLQQPGTVYDISDPTMVTVK